MNAKQPHNYAILNILALSCVFFAPITFFLNFICAISISTRSVLQLWACIFVFAVSFLISLIVYFLKGTKIKNKLYRNINCFYSIISIVFCTIAAIIQNPTITNIYVQLTIVAYAFVASAVISFLKVKSYLLQAIIHYIISVAPFLLITSVISDIVTGNGTMILLGSFTGVYLLITIAYFYFKRSFAQIDNEEKAYKPQFD